MLVERRLARRGNCTPLPHKVTVSARVLVGHQDIKYQPPDISGAARCRAPRLLDVEDHDGAIQRAGDDARVVEAQPRTARHHGRLQDGALSLRRRPDARQAVGRHRARARQARGGRGRQRIAIREWQGVAGGGRGLAGAGVHQRGQVPDPLTLTTYYLRLTTCHLRLTTYVLLTTHCSLLATHQRAQVPYLDERVEAARDHLRLQWGLANPNPLS